MATFVLVHGGWGGGWEWRQVADRLAARGHQPHRLTLTGLGDRSHLASPEVNLDTHITDVLMVLQFEDLSDVVLVGQSYGGAVITGAADRAPERIRRLVYVDAFVPNDGDSVIDLSPQRFVDLFRQLAAETGDGWQVPSPFDPGDLGPPEMEGWYAPKLVPHPLACFDQPIRLSGASDTVPRSYIDCRPADAQSWVFERFADRARSDGWDYHHLPVGHDAQVLAPEALVGILDQVAKLPTPRRP
ncbi:MAG TPA: alpha/beta fold hydrolase [Candidatus Limnocylindrales bacterium]|nr:alpha/beta fold hydrolase [Candidatus Limnocylindrales bacterium]